MGANLWRWILQTDAGVLNETLRFWGLPDLALNWLADPNLALLSVTVAYSWAGYPFVMLLILAGLQGIPREFYEAAQSDGANGWQIFRYITVPSLAVIIGIALLLETISALNSFDTLFVMTGGGPAGATEIWGIAIFNAVFADFNYGGASALSMILFLGTALFFFLYGSANSAVSRARSKRP